MNSGAERGLSPMGRINHLLREIPFFEEFSGDELEYFTINLSLRSVPAETILFRKEEIGDYLFFIIEGMVEICLESSDLRQIILAKFERGSCVGEMAIVDDYPRSATVVVRREAELLILSRSRFESICEERPPVGIKFLRGIAKNLSTRLRKTNGRFADLS